MKRSEKSELDCLQCPYNHDNPHMMPVLKALEQLAIEGEVRPTIIYDFSKELC